MQKETWFNIGYLGLNGIHDPRMIIVNELLGTHGDAAEVEKYCNEFIEKYCKFEGRSKLEKRYAKKVVKNWMTGEWYNYEPNVNGSVGEYDKDLWMLLVVSDSLRSIIYLFLKNNLNIDNNKITISPCDATKAIVETLRIQIQSSAEQNLSYKDILKHITKEEGLIVKLERIVSEKNELPDPIANKLIKLIYKQRIAYEGVCSKCSAKIESDSHTYCPYCSSKIK